MPARARLDDDLQSISTVEDLEIDALTRSAEDPELQAAIAMSLQDFPRPASPGDRHASTRSLEEAGIPATPGSARARKRRGGRKP